MVSGPVQNQSVLPDMTQEELMQPIMVNHNDIFTGYMLDLSNDELELQEDENVDTPGQLPARTPPNPLFPAQAPSPLKCQKLDIPVHITHQNMKPAREAGPKKALTNIKKLIASKCDVFMAGQNLLQAYQGRTIQSCSHMMLNSKQGLVDSSKKAAESQEFAQNWGGRLVRSWVHMWIKERKLSVSLRGKCVKVFTLLSDPVICTELQAYVRSNKWAIDPEKLAEFNKDQMVPVVAKIKFIRL